MKSIENTRRIDRARRWDPQRNLFPYWIAAKGCQVTGNNVHHGCKLCFFCASGKEIGIESSQAREAYEIIKRPRRGTDDMIFEYVHNEQQRMIVKFGLPMKKAERLSAMRGSRKQRVDRQRRDEGRPQMRFEIDIDVIDAEQRILVDK